MHEIQLGSWTIKPGLGGLRCKAHVLINEADRGQIMIIALCFPTTYTNSNSTKKSQFSATHSFSIAIHPINEHFEHLSDLKSRAGNKCATLKSPSVLHLIPSCFWEKETEGQKLICLIWKWKTLCAVIFSLQARALVAICWANTIPTPKLLVKSSKVIRALLKPTTKQISHVCLFRLW